MRRWFRLLICGLVLAGCAHSTPVPSAPLRLSPVPADALLVGGKCSGALCYDTIAAAMRAAQPGDTIAVAPGTYTEKVVFSQPRLTLMGSGMPELVGRKLSGGTILVGSIDCNSQPGARVSHLGVVASPESSNAIVSGTPGHGQVMDHMFEHLALLGPGYAARTHALLCNSGSGLTIRNLRMYHWYHGLAIKCVDATVEDVYGLECTGSTIIVKSDRGTGDAAHVAISGVEIDGTGSGQRWGGSIVVESAADDFRTFDVQISDVTARYAGRGAILISRLRGVGAISDITVTNVLSEHAGSTAERADYDVSGADNVLLRDCVSIQSRGYGFRAGDDVTGVVVLGGQVSGAHVAEYVGDFAQLEINGAHLVP